MWSIANFCAVELRVLQKSGILTIEEFLVPRVLKLAMSCVSLSFIRNTTMVSLPSPLPPLLPRYSGFQLSFNSIFFPGLLHSFRSVQPLSHVRLFETPWTTARQASLSITNSRSPPKPMSIELVMLSSHLILCCPLLLLPPILPSIRVFSNESTLSIGWPKY